MLSKEEILAIAQKHAAVQQMPESYAMRCVEIAETSEHVLFDYIAECLADIPEEEQDQLGGAPGFRVDKSTGEVHDIPWSEYPGACGEGPVG